MENVPLTKNLEAHRDEVEQALAVAVPGNWPDTAVCGAEQPQAIA